MLMLSTKPLQMVETHEIKTTLLYDANIDRQG